MFRIGPHAIAVNNQARRPAASDHARELIGRLAARTEPIAAHAPFIAACRASSDALLDCARS